MKLIDIEQGTAEWLALRRQHITATDAPVIMGVSPWKTPRDLFFEKVVGKEQQPRTWQQQRGIDLEPRARELFSIRTGIDVQPRVVVNDWQMASLDGLSDDLQTMVEIKCAGAVDHEKAKRGNVPDHYYPQLQHQMHVVGVYSMYYMSFDGLDGVILDVKRDDDFIAKMIEQERAFYACMINQTLPEPTDKDILEMSDSVWINCAAEMRSIHATMKELQAREKELRELLVTKSGGRSSKGGGLTLSKVIRKGSIEYGRIPELSAVDLEQYRSAPVEYYRVSFE